MKPLTSSQCKYLRGLAHHLKPVVQIGKHGLTDLVLEKIDQELKAHELIKVQFLGFQDQKKALTELITTRSESILIGMIGHMIILYREHADPERRIIILPAG